MSAPACFSRCAGPEPDRAYFAFPWKAGEAARAGGQAIDVTAALAGDVRIDPAAAVAAAQDYLARNDVAGSVDVLDGDTLQVTTTVTEPTVFLGLIGIDSFTVHGAGTAELVVTANAQGRAGP